MTPMPPENPVEPMDRPLVGGEKALHALDFTAPMGFVTIARVRGPLTEAMLRAGLDAVHARHPYLRARIVDTPEGPAFRAGSAAPLLRLASGAWEPEAERELDERLPFETGPLMRCVWVTHGSEAHTLLLSFHHSVSDGMSGVYLMRDLLRAAAGERDAALADTRPTEHRLPPQAQGWKGSAGTLKFLAREALRTASQGQPLKVPRDAAAPAKDRRAKVIPVVLDAAALTQLAARARSEKATVHSALAAAMLLAILADAKRTAPTRVSFGSPVNLRKQLVPAVGEDLGFFVSMLVFGAKVAPTDPLWSVARALRAQTVADQDSGMALGALGMLGGFVKLLSTGSSGPEQLAARMENALQSTTGLTNLGRLEVPTQYGPLAVEALHFLANPTAMGDWMATATSLHGALFWNFIWPEPLISRPHAEALAADTVARLRQAFAP